jgi:UDP-glucose 4-epimerase
MTLSNKRILVAGGAGFIGSHVCENLLQSNPEQLIIADDFSLGKQRNISKITSDERVKLYITDVSQYELMLNLLKMESVDIIFNLAVIPLPASLVEPKKTVDKNILITSTLCDLLFKGLYASLIHISSSEAYGTSIYSHKSMDENHPTYPTTPYAASKLACDHIALSYHRTFGLDIAIARPFNAYGPRQNEKSYAGVIPLTISRILKGEPPIIHGDGLQTRDYTYVEDIASAIPRFYEEKATRGKIINLASGKEVTINYLIGKIVEIMEYKGTITRAPQRQGDVRRHIGDISLAKEIINYKPKTDLQEGLEKTIKWYKNNAQLTP